MSNVTRLALLFTVAFSCIPSTSFAGVLKDGKEQTKLCEFSQQDSLWVQRAISAWHFANASIAKVSEIPEFEVILFDAHCQQESSNALNKQGQVSWTSRLHQNAVLLPDGVEMPPMVNSFTSSSNDEEGKTFFVMSVPSVWRDGGVKSSIDLDTFMIPVMLHEAMHAIQSSTYGKRIQELSKQHNLPESFNDDSVQEIFKDNSEFALSVEKEIDLLMQAALESNDAQARHLAQTARNMITARYNTWMKAEFEKYRDIDDVWLTMEGSGQWLGYRWLSLDDGGHLTQAEAIEAFGLRGKWWSQKLGFALFMALDRLSDNWKGDAFGQGNKTILTLLDDALLQE